MKMSARNPLVSDLLLVAFLIALCVAARLLPHTPGVWPFAASALFAGYMLNRPALAVIVPIAAAALSNTMLDGDDWRITLVVYAAIAVPALFGMLTRGRGMLAIGAATVSSSLVFFVTTNFAVWAFGSLGYSHDWQGLVKCYIAALPFLDRTILGDAFWTVALFGGAWLVQHGPALARRSS